MGAATRDVGLVFGPTAPPLVVRVPEAARLLRISEHHVRNLIDRRLLRAVRSGRVLLIPVDALTEYLNDNVIDGK